MKKSDKIKRTIAYYFFVGFFFILLPIVLSYSLGYKIDFRNLMVYKTGMIYVNSKPTGGSIYLNGRKLPDFTPARIEELKPGMYNVEVRREGFYPWQKELIVNPNMVTKADDIVLFSSTQEIKHTCDYEVVDFAVSDKKQIYYMTNKGLFRTNMDGTNIKRMSLYSNWPCDITAKHFSPDGNKLLYNNRYKIWVIYFNLDKSALPKDADEAAVKEVFTSKYPIVDLYWYSESNHIVLVTEKDINVAELNGEGERNVVTLYKFNSSPRGLYYDETSDSLYFIDMGRLKGDVKEGLYTYRLDLRQKFFGQLMRRLKKEFEIIYEQR